MRWKGRTSRSLSLLGAGSVPCPIDGSDDLSSLDIDSSLVPVVLHFDLEPPNQLQPVLGVLDPTDGSLDGRDRLWDSRKNLDSLLGSTGKQRVLELGRDQAEELLRSVVKSRGEGSIGSDESDEGEESRSRVRSGERVDGLGEGGFSEDGERAHGLSGSVEFLDGLRDPSESVMVDGRLDGRLLAVVDGSEGDLVVTVLDEVLGSLLEREG